MSVLHHLIADLSARALLYYVGLERQLAVRWQFDLASREVRLVGVDNHQAIFQQLETTVKAQLAESRRKELTKLKEAIRPLGPDSVASIQLLITNVLEWETVAQRGELNKSDNIFNLQRTQERLQHTLIEEQRGNLAISNTRQTSELNLPPHSYKTTNVLVVQTPVQESILTMSFLGKHYLMFQDIALEQPITSWRALKWLVELWPNSSRGATIWPNLWTNFQELAS